MKNSRQWWWIIGAGAALVVGAVAWITMVMLELERSEHHARTRAEFQESLRLALWRMDSWMVPLLAREAARPIEEYQSFYNPSNSYNLVLSKIPDGQILNPSPLLGFNSDYLPLHFQYGSDEQWTSPQVPLGNQRDLAEANGFPGTLIDNNDALLSQIGQCVDLVAMDQQIRAEEEQAGRFLNDPIRFQAYQTEVDQPQQHLKNKSEWLNRGQSVAQARSNVNPQLDTRPLLPQADPSRSPGPLVPFWVESEDDAEIQLVIARRVPGPKGDIFQGFLTDWNRIREALLDQVRSLFPTAKLIAIPDRTTLDEEQESLSLATVPVRLDVPAPIPPPMALITPARGIMGLTWLAVLLAIIAAASTLRASIDYGERRSKFASSVTHELRTPLTTFQMYSDMLASGMIRDPRQQAEYLETLKKESGRLSRLVENVLAYARMEEGRLGRRRETLRLGDLLERFLPAFEQHAVDAGFEWTLDCSIDLHREVTLDPDAVEQILFNLIDNACKYGGTRERAALMFSVDIEDRRLVLSVRDFGIGIPAQLAREVFEPFERGTLEAGNNDKPGVGLGLALARGLARDLGGELSLDPDSNCGACFRLTLPIESAALNAPQSESSS